MRKADMVVAVKRLPPEMVRALQQSGTPWILDVVDFYPQPKCSTWSREAAIRWVQGQIKELKPHGIIWPNQRMMDDCQIDLPGTVIYHHYRPDAPVNPIRERVAMVGYEGSPNYIGEWLEPIREACVDRKSVV